MSISISRTYQTHNDGSDEKTGLQNRTGKSQTPQLYVAFVWIRLTHADDRTAVRNTDGRNVHLTRF